MTLRRLVLVRHGETEFNAEGRMQGQLESELTDKGRRQARMIGPLLARYEPARLTSSDLSRAASTAEELGQVLGLPVKLDARLRETNLGEWQGLTIREVEVRWPAQVERWRIDPTWAPPGGESRVQVAERAMPVVSELEAEFTDGALTTALLCAHGGLIAGLVCALIGLEEPSWTAIGGLGNARWAVVRRRQVPGSPWRLTGFDLGPLQ